MLRSAKRAAEAGAVSPLGVVVPPCPTKERRTALFREWYRWYHLAWRKTRAPKFRMVKRKPWERQYTGIHHTPKPYLLDIYAMRASGCTVRQVGARLGVSVATAHALVEKASAECRRPTLHKLLQLHSRVRGKMEVAA